MRKRKDGHSSNQIMTSSSSFVALTKAKVARLKKFKKKNQNKTIPNDTLQKLILQTEKHS